jgi:peptidoglycan hydrolase-like protein with peptidoglycan-binding domain
LETIRLGETCKVIQTALNRIGYGPLPVDGNAGSETLDAIRRFELDNGMPVTGQVGDALVARLYAIGAIKPG